MKITTQIEKSAAKKDIRENLNYVYLDRDNDRLLATDGHILAVVPAQCADDDVSGYVSVDAIKAARKANKHDATIKANGSLAVVNGPTFDRPDPGLPFPDIDRVIPEVTGDPDIALNAKLLLQLAEAISDTPNRIVHLRFARNSAGDICGSSAVHVTSGNNPDNFGVIMPVRRD